MRILLACAHFRCIGGVEEVVGSLGAALAAAGQPVAVLSTPDLAPYLIGHERVPPANVECFYRKIPELKRVSWRHPERLVKDTRRVRELVDLLKLWRPDIVNSHSLWDRLPTIAHVCRAAGVPLVQSAYGTWAREELGARTLAALKHADAITMLSGFSKRHYEALSPAVRDAHTIICGVDAVSAKAALPKRRDRPYIFCTCRLQLNHKALDVLVSAFAIVAPQYPELDLLISGDGPDREKIEALVASAGLAERVQMLGPTPRDELWGLYKGAVLFAMPSRAPEALGLVFLEAMACGIPVVGTNSGGTPELVSDGETGLLIDRNEPEELASAIRMLLDNPELRSEMGRRGEEVAAQYSWSRVADRYLEVYSSCIASKSRWRTLPRLVGLVGR